MAYVTDPGRLSEVKAWYQSRSNRLGTLAQEYLRNIGERVNNGNITPKEFNTMYEKFKLGEDSIGEARRDLEEAFQNKMKSVLVCVD
tara:strand:+ start:252 stop:512 length:261 start_codon:yes stop_codon:yes gene_type:complete